MKRNPCTIRNFFVVGASLSAALLLSTVAHAQNEWFVDDNADSGGDGSDWPVAFNDLQLALNQAFISPGSDLIKVAQGTYKPSVPHCLGCDPDDITDRHNTFLLDFIEVTIKGGYKGCPDGICENPDDRDVDLYETILSGEIGDPGIDDNAYHVVTIRGTLANETVIFRGLSITAGNANGPIPHDADGGGGMLITGEPSVIRCIFTNNNAGGVGGAATVDRRFTLRRM